MKREVSIHQTTRNGRGTTRTMSLIMLVALIVAPVPDAIAEETTVRSGTIVTGGDGLGYFVGDDLDGCRNAPDCRAWLEAGCAPALAGLEPGLTASIEDVADLADGRTPWRFAFEPVSDCCGGWGVVQFWRRNCTEIASSKWDSGDCQGGPPNYCSSTFLRIPRSARWMTVTGYPNFPWVTDYLHPQDALTLDWTLSGPTSLRSKR